MKSDLEQPLKGVKIAITVDDMFEWIGTRRFANYSFLEIAQRFSRAFEAHNIRGVYSFNNTAAAVEDVHIKTVFDYWCAQGQYVGNHTHHHGSVDWMPSSQYIDDIEQSERIILPWVSKSPRRFFRYCFDMWGSSFEKQQDVGTYLAREGYEIAPISIWFYDANFAQAYIRSLATGDESAQHWLRERFVETAIEQLRVQAAAARVIFQREPAHIWLIHGTAIAADCLSRVLDEYARLGVEFVSLEEAMQDPMNQRQPVITEYFRNQVQKWSEFAGVAIENCPPEILSRLDSVAPAAGLSEHELVGGYFTKIAESMSLDINKVGLKIA